MFACRPEPGRDEQRSDLIAVQADGMGFVVDPGSTDVDGWRMGNQTLLFGVAVEARHGAQSPADGGRCSTPGLQLTSVGVAGKPSVAAEEPGEGYVFRTGKLRVVDDNGCRCGGHGIPPKSVGLGRR